MKNNTTLTIALAALFTSSMAMADFEASGKVIMEQGSLMNTGSTIGASNANDPKTSHKEEISFRMYGDGDINDYTTFHYEGQAFIDNKGMGTGAAVGNTNYTQREGLRELYVDTKLGDMWDLRLGKQQVVWGTADGMKLLDMINPTDYSEMAQNQMEDSRIPVWMINAESGPVQVVLSQPRENVFAGLNRNIVTSERKNDPANNSSDLTVAAGADQGHAFIMKGVDSITGKTNGFLNIVPDLGSVANGFYGVFGAGLKPNPTTVSQFANMGAAYLSTNGLDGLPGVDGGTAAEQASFDDNAPFGATIGGYGANNMDGTGILHAFASSYDSNLINSQGSAAGYGGTAVDDSAFEYMDNATFGTFDAFAGAKSKYVYNMPNDDSLNFATRFKESTESGLNYSLNFSRNYDSNPIINLSWVDDNGVALKQTMNGSNVISLTNQAGTVNFGANGGAINPATLQFEQKVERVTNIGGSFDTAIETAALGPIVIRGEALYQKDVYSPVMDLTALGLGDLANALTMQKGDRIKFVLGADITVLTNMMISGQFIQDSNLDYVDTTTTIGGTTNNRFTADYATMHLTNGFNKAIENKNFYSLFFSKPFGASGQHRWNNILMIEEGANGDDAYWNRFDVGFGMTDDLEGTVELNNYWGNENTQFGQLEKSSNMQVGVKLSF